MKTMQDYTNFCTEQQTHRAFKLGAPIEWHKRGEKWDNEKERWYNNPELLPYNFCIKEDSIYKKPTTQQMIGWLREKLNFTDFRIEYWSHKQKYGYFIHSVFTEITIEIRLAKYDTYEQAELAAIDVALDYLEKGGIK